MEVFLEEDHLGSVPSEVIVFGYQWEMKDAVKKPLDTGS
jgi:hypothetical protein